MRTILAIALLTAGASPALAGQTTYDAFSSFSAVPGETGAFSYGSFDIPTATFTPFTAGGHCNTPNVICQSGGQLSPHDLPAVFKSTAGTFTFSTATVPSSALVLHPGFNIDESNSIAVLFTAPRAGAYTFNGTAAISDIAPTGTNLYAYSPSSGTPVTRIGSLSSASPTFTAVITTVALGRGGTTAFIIGNAGDYRNDSTAVNITAAVAGVPDAGTWATMIAGLAMVGIASRRRRITVAA